jgi:MoxR-like ATPase
MAERTADRLVLLVDGAATDEHDLTAKQMLIGADAAAAIRHASLQPRHAQLERSGGVWTVRALDGAALTHAGAPAASVRLDHGAEFALGPALFRFQSARATIERTALAGKKFSNPAEAAAGLKRMRDRILEQVGGIVVGQSDVVAQVLVAMFAQGHCLLVGAPGLAKTLLARVLAGTLDLQHRRIQFTPDLMPSDITGTEVLEEDPVTGRRSFKFRPGPLFTNLLLADEINRTPPKTQAALLEAMQERRITAAGITYDLPQPFLVLATQNPIEQEGTYPLPEAQLDRFMFCVHVGYPSAEEEVKILLDTTRDLKWEVDRLLGADGILQFQHLVRQVPVSPHVAGYAAALIRASRPGTPEAPSWLNGFVRFGAGPRAGQYLLLAAKSHALLNGDGNVSCADVRAYALPVLRHRIFTSFAAAAEGVDSDEVVRRLLKAVPEPAYRK